MIQLANIEYGVVWNVTIPVEILLYYKLSIGIPPLAIVVAIFKLHISQQLINN